MLRMTMISLVALFGLAGCNMEAGGAGLLSYGQTMLNHGHPYPTATVNTYVIGRQHLNTTTVPTVGGGTVTIVH